VGAVLFSLLVSLREGVEIALVIAIVLGYLQRTGRGDHARQVWAGVGIAAGLCLILGAVLEFTAASLSGQVLEAFEGFTMLFAVAVLTWMIFWMKRQAAGIGRHLRAQVDAAVRVGSPSALVLLAFSAVAREGLETVLFLFAGARNASAVEYLLGGVLGFSIAAAIGYGVYRGSSRLPLRQFFLVSGVALIVLAAGLISNALAELREAGIILAQGVRPWDTDGFLSMNTDLGRFLHTLVGYDSAPTVAQIVAYWGYLLGALTFFLSGTVFFRRRPAAPKDSASLARGVRA
jgi:high-affinity iron transporter